MFENGLRFWRHPVHTMLVHFPLGLLVASLAWDAAALFIGDPAWWKMAYYTIALGLIASVPTAISGLVDYIAAMRNRAEEIGRAATSHMMASLVGMTFFLASWLIRRQEFPGTEWSWWAVACSVLGAICLIATGRLGGTLVLEYDVGHVEDDDT